MTTLQMGWTNPLSGQFGAHPSLGGPLNLNDGATYTLVSPEGLELPLPPRTLVPVGNVRTRGERAVRAIYRSNREARCQVILGPMTTYAALVGTVRTLLEWVNAPPQTPVTLQYQPPQAGSPVYLDVVGAAVDIPSDEDQWLALQLEPITIVFWCRPGLRGDRVCLQNLAWNPGFEAPSGPGVVAFSDGFANFDAYTVQSYRAAVLADGPAAYYRLCERSGTTAGDSSGNGYAGTYAASGVTLGLASFNGDAACAAAGFDGASGHMDVPYAPGLNTSAWSVEAWVYPTGGSGTRVVVGNHDATHQTGWVVQINSAGNWQLVVGSGGGSASVTGGAAATGAWTYLAATYDGTTARLYVNGASVGSAATSYSAQSSYPLRLAADNQTLGSYFTGNLDEVAVYASVLSSTRIGAHYSAGAAYVVELSRYADAVLADAPVRYFRCDETSGTTAYDASPQLQNGTYAGSPAFGVAGALAGDADSAVTFNGTSGHLTLGSSTGLPTGSSPLASLECWLKFASTPSSTAVVAELGNHATGDSFQITLNTTGTLQAAISGVASTPAGGSLSTGTWHHVVATYDGASLRLYVDGSLYGGPTSASWTPSYSGAIGAFGSTSTSANWFAGSMDECAMYAACLSASRVSAHYSAGHNSPSASLAGSLAIPAGGRVSFGSPAWSAINQWSVRFRYNAGATLTFYLHYTDANDFLAAVLTESAPGNATLTLNHVVGGTIHQLAQQTGIWIVPGVWYWLVATQFPWVGTNPPQAQTFIYIDNGGAPGAAVSGTVGPVNTYDAVTALSGQPQLAVAGASLPVGGLASGNGHTLTLFGPGAWQLAPAQNGAGGRAALGWDGSVVYSAGPVASAYSARVDLPPAGTVDAWLRLYAGGAISPQAGAYPIPVASAGDTLAVAAWVQTSAGFGAGAVLALVVTEYDANGNQLRQNTAASVTGPHASWTQLATSYTTGASCAYADLALRVQDASATFASAGQTVWWENVQVWDQTQVGLLAPNQAAMPYCELRFPQSPAQAVVSGLLGDLPAPCYAGLGTYLAAFSPGANLSVLLGRRNGFSASTKLVGVSHGLANASITYALDSTSYGGYVLSALTTSSGWNPRGFSDSVAHLQGVYHLWSRFQSNQSVGNLANVQQRVLTAQSALPWFDNAQLTDLLGEYYGPYVAPLSASSTWTLCDAGQVAIPPFPQGTLTDPTQNYVVPRPQSIDTTGGGSTLKINWQLLLPVDGSLLAGIVNNAVNAPYTVTQQWLWLYVDGLLVNRAGVSDGPSWTYSVESGPLANPAHGAGGSGTQGTGTINANYGADPYLTLDPTVGNSGAGGVNQLAGVIADNVGDVLPLALDLVYTPLYLEVR